MRIVANGWFWDQLNTGSGQYLAGLVDRLPEVVTGAELLLVLPAGRAPGRPGPRPPWQAIEAGLTLERAGRNLAKVWFEQVTFPRLCRRLRADVAWTPYWGSSFWRPCPAVVTVHDLIPRLLPAYRGGPAQRLYTWLVSVTARRSQAVLTDSEASRRDIGAALRISAGRVHAVHLAVDDRFRPIHDQAELDRVRARYGLPDGPFFLYLGGFDVRKNLARTLHAFARVARPAQPGAPSGPRATAPRLVIAGKLPAVDSAFAPDPRPVVARLGIEDLVHFTGWVDEADKPALYSLATAALFVSEYEGFGLPVLEAQACGCPVITAA